MSVQSAVYHESVQRIHGTADSVEGLEPVCGQMDNFKCGGALGQRRDVGAPPGWQHGLQLVFKYVRYVEKHAGILQILLSGNRATGSRLSVVRKLCRKRGLQFDILQRQLLELGRKPARSCQTGVAVSCSKKPVT